MNIGKKLKVWELSALLALCTALCLGTWAQGRQSSISSNLVRLHVIAASDSEEEQALKLRVRDAVLDYLGGKLDSAETSDEAQSILRENLSGIERAAVNASEGRSVRVSLTRERYPTRGYAAFTLPAGEYESLRVILGEGMGKNWWCVVFPPLCLSAASAESVREVMSAEDFGIVTEQEGYVLKLRILEIWGRLTEKLQ